MTTKIDKDTYLRLMERIKLFAEQRDDIEPYQRLDLLMDVEFSGVNMAALADADEATFNHDVSGIYRHFNRETRELEDCFLPRVGLAQEGS